MVVIIRGPTLRPSVPKIDISKPAEALKQHLFGRGYRFFERLPNLSWRKGKQSLFLGVIPGPEIGSSASQMSAFILWKYTDGTFEIQLLEDPHDGPHPMDIAWIRTNLNIGIAEKPLNQRAHHKPRGPKRKYRRWDLLVHSRDLTQFKSLYPNA